MFKSKAQVKKFGVLLNQGKISQKTFDEFAHSTPSMKDLPERIHPKEKATSKPKHRDGPLGGGMKHWSGH